LVIGDFSGVGNIADPEHLDGKRRVVVFLFNFFDELRRKVPLGR